MMARQMISQINYDVNILDQTIDFNSIDTSFPTGHSISQEIIPICKKIEDDTLFHLKASNGKDIQRL